MLVVEVVEIPQLQLFEKIHHVPWCGWCRRAENCGCSAVAVRRRGRCLPCRCAEAVPHGPDCSDQTIAVPQLQLIDKVADVLRVHVVQVPQVQVVTNLTSFPTSWCRSWRRQSRFHSCHVNFMTKLLTCPLLSTTGAYGPDSAENCVLSDHRDSTVAVLPHVVDVPVVMVVQAPQWWRQSRSHSCHNVEKIGFLTTMAVAVGKGVFRTPSTWTSSARLAATFLSPRWPTVVGRRGLSCCSCDS